MNKTIFFGVVFSLALLATTFHFGSSHTAQAQSFEEYYIEPSWGALRGSMGNRFLLFEDADGTVRVVNMADADPIKKTLRVDRILKRKAP